MAVTDKSAKPCQLIQECKNIYRSVNNLLGNDNALKRNIQNARKRQNPNPFPVNPTRIK